VLGNFNPVSPGLPEAIGRWVFWFG